MVDAGGAVSQESMNAWTLQKFQDCNSGIGEILWNSVIAAANWWKSQKINDAEQRFGEILRNSDKMEREFVKFLPSYEWMRAVLSPRGQWMHELWRNPKIVVQELVKICEILWSRPRIDENLRKSTMLKQDLVKVSKILLKWTGNWWNSAPSYGRCGRCCLKGVHKCVNFSEIPGSWLGNWWNFVKFSDRRRELTRISENQRCWGKIWWNSPKFW